LFQFAAAILPRCWPDSFGWPITAIELSLNPDSAATEIGAWYGNETNGSLLLH
jgi:hypothetical protein